jgi:hypothetical protein
MLSWNRNIELNKLRKELNMKFARKNCIDCGSDAVKTIVDEVKPVYKMEIINFACGAELKNTFASNGNICKVSHTGCGHEALTPSL